MQFKHIIFNQKIYSMKYLFLFIFLSVSVMSSAQSTWELTPNSESLINTNYVYLYTQNIVKAESILYENKVFKKDYFLVDGERYELGQIKFYQNEDGFFGKVNDGYQSGYAEKTQGGEINLFELSVQTSSAPMMDANGMMTGGYGGTKIIDYYNKGFGNLKRATYYNLKMDLSDKPEAQLYLDKYNKSRMVQNGLYVTCGALLVGSLVTFFNQAEANPKDFNPSSTFLVAGLGAASGLAAYIIGMEKKEKLKEAVNAYNGF